MALPPEIRSPAEHVPKIAAVLASDAFPSGDRAALKRMALGGPAPLAFHRFLLRLVDERLQPERLLPAWRTLICALALQKNGGFDPHTPFGRALSEAGFAEARLERLLSARGDTLLALLLRAARMLAAKRLAADWREAARLLFANEDAAEEARLAIARAYYKHQSAQTKKD